MNVIACYKIVPDEQDIVVNGDRTLSLDKAAWKGKILVERSLEDQMEVIQVCLPAGLSVTWDINVPRVSTMKEILAAGKKPTTVWKDGDITAWELAVETVSILAPEVTAVILGSKEDAEMAADYCGQAVLVPRQEERMAEEYVPAVNTLNDYYDYKKGTDNLDNSRDRQEAVLVYEHQMPEGRGKEELYQGMEICMSDVGGL